MAGNKTVAGPEHGPGHWLRGGHSSRMVSKTPESLGASCRAEQFIDCLWQYAFFGETLSATGGGIESGRGDSPLSSGSRASLMFRLLGRGRSNYHGRKWRGERAWRWPLGKWWENDGDAWSYNG